MDKLIMERELAELLAVGGYATTPPGQLRSAAFDMVARKDDALLFIKVLFNIDAFEKESASELLQVARSLKGSAMVVGHRCGGGDLEDGVVYSRLGVPIVTAGTLREFILEDVPPLIFAAPGGFYVNIDGEALRMARESRNISLGTLAEVAGVSRRTISMYGDGMGAVVDVALRLEEFLGTPIIVPIDPFSMPDAPEGSAAPHFDRRTDFEHAVFGNLFKLGFTVMPVQKCPFEAVTSDEKVVLLTGVEEDKSRLKAKARNVSTISVISERDSVIFVRSQTRQETIEGVPVMTPLDLRKIDDPADLEHDIERKRRRAPR